VARPMREPQRTCVGCRRVRPKGELVRLVREAGEVVLDRAGCAAGRGAYVCPEAECLRRARGRLIGALRTNNVDFERLVSELPVEVAG
jgi:predicted RNA-binding protein YlxR (DUF448 family)